MLIKVLFEQEVWIESDERVTENAFTRPMRASELFDLRDNNPREYDRIVDDAFDKAERYVACNSNEGCTTLLDVEDE